MKTCREYLRKKRVGNRTVVSTAKDTGRYPPDTVTLAEHRAPRWVVVDLRIGTIMLCTLTDTTVRWASRLGWFYVQDRPYFDVVEGLLVVLIASECP